MSLSNHLRTKSHFPVNNAKQNYMIGSAVMLSIWKNIVAAFRTIGLIFMIFGPVHPKHLDEFSFETS
jgi:hypothetical protein